MQNKENRNLSVVVLGCDANQDLLPLVDKSAKCFSDAGVRVLYAGESENKSQVIYLEYISTFESNFSKRFNKILSFVETEYVLVLLDDYYIFDNNLDKKIPIWINSIKVNNGTVLSLTKNNKYLSQLKKIDYETRIYHKLNPYDIDFHPTIWRTKNIVEFVSSRDDNPWQLEPQFIRYLNENKLISLRSKIPIDYEELLIRGSFFRKPFKKYVRNIYHGGKKQITLLKSIFWKIKMFVYHITPRFVINLFKNRNDSKSK